MKFSKVYLVLVFFISQLSFSQEGIAVYADYLSDNYYLLHPSMAGAANCAKVRLSGRSQWTGQQDSPALYTMTINGRVGDKSGIGMIVYSDKNGYNAQKGLKLTYAYHLLLSRDDIDLNQLSFGINADFMQFTLDESSFLPPGGFDPNINGSIQTDPAFNIDFGMSYNYLDFYAHFTIRNAIDSGNDIYSDVENPNQRDFIINTGYVFGDAETLMWEPSVMYQYYDATSQSVIDLNLKAYKQLDFGLLWGGLSYRRDFSSTEYTDSSGNLSSQYLQDITPIVGINYKQFMFAYTYTYGIGSEKYESSGFNLITLGYNFGCRKERYHCNCPAVN